MTNILFVCLGNICRSQMAETMFKQMVEDQSMTGEINVESAGTSSYEQGNPPHPGAVAELAKYGMSMAGQVSRPVNQDDFKWADLIIGMDSQNIQSLKKMAPEEDQSKIHLCLDILSDQKGEDIPDPWYDHRFDRTYKQLSEALPEWMNYIKQRH
ncbi:protein-tyrosine-phosphatase [Lentilactobacillus curieae]|uniref:protein-tyrosine-phosphatase n=1 Tax=Lentilactobacillus curieae TaxID=1138822 RepID=A0A1S6QJF9_9LACO|nr:low molecular weight protein-tyrosine-phosphatase [Lentilactobacillus curieae]AQW21723.1 protein-tyrosine-phosphatase [Lentilactobacillus curieae]